MKFRHYVLMVLTIIACGATNPDENRHHLALGGEKLATKTYLGLRNLFKDPDEQVRVKYIDGLLVSALQVNVGGQTRLASVGGFGVVWNIPESSFHFEENKF